MNNEWKSILDDIAKMASGAMSLADGFRQEAADKWRHKMEQNIKKLDVVTRTEFKALQAMVIKARAEQDKILAELQQIKSGFSTRSARPQKAKAAKTKNKSAKTKKRA